MMKYDCHKFCYKECLIYTLYIVNFNDEEKESKLRTFYYLAVIEVITYEQQMLKKFSRCVIQMLYLI